MHFDFDLVIQELNQMVADGITETYAVGGAVAANIFTEPATTEDVDVFVVFKQRAGLLIDPTPVLDYFKNKGYKMKEDRMVIGGWPVQFLPPPGALEDEAVGSSLLLTDGDKPPLRILTLEYLAAIALKTGRPKDKTRLLQILATASLDRTRFESIVSRHGLGPKWDDFRTQFLSNEN